MTALPIPPMPVPELKCKGWLCFMLATNLENAGWKDGLCPECQDEIERDEIRGDHNLSRYEQAKEEAADSAMRRDKEDRE